MTVLETQLQMCDFNPRSRKGFDLPAQNVGFPTGYFNPRSRKGFDAQIVSINVNMRISIHEAAKASTMFFDYLIMYSLFQSTKPQRLRRFVKYILLTLVKISIHEAAKASTLESYGYPVFYKFQSTKPQRLRPQYTLIIHTCTDFNPRSRKGFDSKNIQKTISFLKTIYTHIIISRLTITTF